MARLRLSLTIPGAVSLGAYEGGALAALIVAAEALGEEILTIDSIASASAGSITGLLTARSLLGGVDPVRLLAAAWVENVSFNAMKTRSTRAPLSSEALAIMAKKVLGPDGVPSNPTLTRQSEPVRLSMALTSLAGLTYNVPDLSRNTVVQASTYSDWRTLTLTRTISTEDYVNYAEAAIASGANAIGFPAKRLNRLPDKQQYVDAGLQGFPDDGEFWYTDGGTVDNEPLGRTIDLAEDIGSDDDRLYLLIHPDPAFPSSNPSPVWGGDAPLPPWLRTGAHAFSISRSQSIYEDLKRLEKTNSHLEWIQRVAPAVASGVTEAVSRAELSATQADQLRESLLSAVSTALESVREEQTLISSMANRAPRQREAVAEDDLDSALDDLVRAASGLEDKRPISVEVVSPTVDPSVQAAPAEQLAGAFLFHFGGFLDLKFRQSDFALGFRNMAYWLDHDLESYLPTVDLSPAIQQVNDAYTQLDWDGIRCGGAQLGELPFGGKAELIQLALHVAHVIAHDVIHGEV